MENNNNVECKRLSGTIISREITTSISFELVILTLHLTATWCQQCIGNNYRYSLWTGNIVFNKDTATWCHLCNGDDYSYLLWTGNTERYRHYRKKYKYTLCIIEEDCKVKE